MCSSSRQTTRIWKPWNSTGHLAHRPHPSPSSPSTEYEKTPLCSDTKPAGASAQCRDGSYSFSTHWRGTCSHHGGVAN
ncbi:DUF3761 domain-containing protein [Deinococcus alpinitundrae]|uniref:DUF3761 domain-containing protein n=1 Tax=Deinococcus alpinitundrae TaxID=468913 RepID=UPI0013794100|nr:DUF3761 domain-containing protein [Deinococcus alpinitundrae]